MQSSSSAPSRPAVRSQLSMSGSTVAAGSNDDRSSGDQGWQAEVALTTTAATRVPVTGAPLIGSREQSGVAVGTPSSSAAAAALFERGLDPGKRAQLGAHYTDGGGACHAVYATGGHGAAAALAAGQRGAGESVLAVDHEQHEPGGVRGVPVAVADRGGMGTGGDGV